MRENKTATLNLRITPALKDAARRAAALQHRSIANFVELLIRQYCQEQDIPIPEQAELFDEDERQA